MQTNPVFSVIITAYNYGEFIEEAVASALNQTLSRELYEVIVVDDGSKDDTFERLREFLPHIVYHYKENGGQASAFNEGIARARGEFVAFLDADDYWGPDKLAAVLAKFLEDEEVGCVYHKLVVVTTSGEALETIPQCFDSIVRESSVQDHAAWTTAVGVSTSGISFRARVVRSLLPIPTEFNICADAYLTSCAALVSERFAIIDRALCFYRIHGRNNYSCLSSNGKSLAVKSTELSQYYHNLLFAKRSLLEKEIGCESRRESLVIRSSALKGEAVHIRQKEGSLAALRFLWSERDILMQLPGKYQLFRIGSILLQMFATEPIYNRLRDVYSRSWIWQVVNCK